MRPGPLAAALLFAAGPAPAADPPVVFQAHSFSRVFDDLRAGASAVAGDKGVKAVNRWVKDVFGDKGLEGMDIDRPIAGYVVLAPKPEDVTAVVALPVTGEKEFLALCERVNHQKPRADDRDKTLYHLPPLDPPYKALLRFSDGYAYIVYGFNPAPHAEAKALVPVARLYDPGERGVVAARVHFDRIPLAVKLAAPALFGEVKKTLFGGPGSVLGFGRMEKELLDAVGAEAEKLVARYVKLSDGADVLAARLTVDRQAGTLEAEATLSGKPGSELAKVIGAYKTTPNRFSALATHPDTVFGFRTRLPLFEPEIRAGTAGGLEALRKAAAGDAPDFAKGVLDELFKGLTRTVKTGEFDLAGGVRGPDPNGHFTAVGAVAFEDTAGLEKEFKKFVEAFAPKEFQDGIKWDAAKAGTVSVHTWKFPRGLDGDLKAFGGADGLIAFAFGPHGVYAAIGPDPVAAVKDAVAAKPADAPVLDVVVNPARARKLILALAPNDPEAIRIENLLSKDDKLKSVASLTVDGGKELRVRLALDLRVLPRLMLHRDFERAAREDEKPAEPVPDKK